MSLDPVLTRAFEAIDRRDYEAIELLRGAVRPEHVAPLVDTWRASLPWPAKDLYVTLLMDQRHARVEPVMLDALDAPSVDTRAYAITYLTGSFTSFERLLTPGGWVDEAKVASAIARWRAESTRTPTALACPRCGAALEPDSARCRYCNAALRAPDAAASPEPPWRVEVPGLPDGHDLPLGAVDVRVVRSGAALGSAIRVNVQVFHFRGGEVGVAHVSVHDLAPADRAIVVSCTLEAAGDYDLRVVDPATRALLASSRRRAR